MSCLDALQSLLGATPSLPLPGLRRQTGEDVSLLRALFVARRWQEVSAAPGWSDAQRLAFLHAQEQMQRAHYERHYPQADFLVVIQQNQPVGRLCLWRADQSLRVVDIALLPAWQGRGTGSLVLEAVVALADRLATPCCLSVEPFSPARRLYTRLGFLPGEDQGAYLQMHRPALPRSDAMN